MEPVTARLTTPAQLVASLPLWLGYTPSESIVVVCCHEPRGRVGLTLRIDLPPARQEQALLADLVRRVRHQGATRVLIAVYTDEADSPERPRDALVQRLTQALDDLVVTDALLVRQGRYWSYLCEMAACCPPEGRSVSEGADDDPVRLLEAEQILRGQVVLRDREELEASLTGPQGEAAATAVGHCEGAFGELLDAIREGTQADHRDRMLARWTGALERFRTPPASVDAEEAALLAVSLADRLLRDLLAAEEDLPPMLRLLEELCRLVPAPYDAPVCTLLAWTAYCEGGGAVVTIALERALASDSGYSLALLLQDVVLGQVPPQQVRKLTRDAVSERRKAS